MRTKLYLSALFALLAFVVAANSQTPAFTFQGRLTDGTLPASGTYEMQFSVHDAVSGGAQIGTTVTNTSVNVANGVFSVVLDFSPATPFATGADRWLEIAVRKLPAPTFTTLTPRQQITSSPFAIRSLSSSGADSLSSLCVVCVTDAQISDIDGGKVTGTVANAATSVNVSGIVAVANGGTGSATQNFVDLANPQTIAGAKIMSSFSNVFTGSGTGLFGLSPSNITPGTATINIAGIAAGPAVVTAGAAPSVVNRTMLTLGYASATAITDLTGGIDGQCVVLISLNSNASIPDSGNFRLANNTLAGVSGYTFFPDSTLTLCRSSASGSPRWYETARSINTPVFDLNVTLAGTGSGSVTSSPVGITCASDCTEFYATGTVVTLTPSPAPTSTFAGWSGGGCSGVGTCVTTVAASTSVVATFNMVTHLLTVNKSGTGTGVVSSSPAGISCGADCTESYNSGTSVSLTAAANPGSVFTGWSGGSGTCSSGSTNPCATTVTAAQTVTATFAPAVPNWGITVSSMDFGTTAVGTPVFRTFSVGNNGATVTFSPTVSITGVDASEFQLFSTTCASSWPSGSGCTMQVRFLPTSAGAKSATFQLSSTPGNTASSSMTAVAVP